MFEKRELVCLSKNSGEEVLMHLGALELKITCASFDPSRITCLRNRVLDLITRDSLLVIRDGAAVNLVAATCAYLYLRHERLLEGGLVGAEGTRFAMQ